MKQEPLVSLLSDDKQSGPKQTRTFLWIAVIGSVLVAFVGIKVIAWFVSSKSPAPARSSSSRAATASEPPSAPAETVAVKDRVSSEAQIEAEAYWNRFLTKCTVQGPNGGEYTYWKIHDLASSRSPYYLYQGKGEPTISVDGKYYPPKNLSEADRLNGVDPQRIEYDGMVNLSFEVGRCANCLNGGDEWKDNFEVARKITKIKGQWKVWEQRPEGYYQTEKVDCSK
jgi:hypothetical protein